MADIINVNDVKLGTLIAKDGHIYSVIDRVNNKTAMRGMVVKLKVKDIRTGSITDISYVGGDKVSTVYLDKKKMNYIYEDGTFCVFMDNATYDQISVPKEKLTWELNFLAENAEVTVTSYEGEILGIELPAKVALKVTYTEDAVKGDTINKPQKSATLETNYKIKVPMFIKNGDKVNVDTKTGEYDSRA